MAREHWDTVPLFAYLEGERFGNGLSDEELSLLAEHYQVVVLGKWVGRLRRGSAEAGNVEALDQLKQRNPELPVYCWWSVKDCPTLFFDSMAEGRLPDDYFARDLDGELYFSVPEHPDVLAWNTANPDMRRWWVTTIVDHVLTQGFDGVLIDGVKRYVMRSDVIAQVLGDDVSRGIAAGVDALMTDLHGALADTGKATVYNGIKTGPQWADGGTGYLDTDLANGVMLESFGRGSPPSSEPAAMVADMSIVTRIANQDKAVLFVAGPQTPPSPDRAFEFALACFLCCAGDNSYFQFAGLSLTTHGPNRAYHRPLGAPRGPAEPTSDALGLRRDFEHASVNVDVSTGRSTISWFVDD